MKESDAHLNPAALPCILEQALRLHETRLKSALCGTK
jgi:hypothetical protein